MPLPEDIEKQGRWAEHYNDMMRRNLDDMMRLQQERDVKFIHEFHRWYSIPDRVFNTMAAPFGSCWDVEVLAELEES